MDPVRQQWDGQIPVVRGRPRRLRISAILLAALWGVVFLIIGPPPTEIFILMAALTAVVAIRSLRRGTAGDEA